MKRTVLLVIILLVINVTGLLSCNPCWNVKPQNACVIYTDIGIRCVNEAIEEVKSNAHVTYDDLSIELTVTDDKNSCYNTNKPSLFGNTAYACSVSDILTIQDSIMSIEVYSDADFDDQHKAGTNLVELFSIPSITELNLADNYDHYYLKLQQAPAMVSVHGFTVKVIQKSGAEFVLTSEHVTIGR